MRVHKMSITMVEDNGCQPVTIRYDSPNRIICGTKLKLGWWFIRIGAKILYGKDWEGR